VEAIVVAEAAEATCRLVESAVVGATGLDGDRYAAGAGTFSAPGTSGRHVTLVEAEALESAGVAFTAARRNVVTRGVDLDALIGQEFALGSARLVGRRRCEPCAHLERLEGPGLLRPLVHRGGLRADVVATGSVSVGDAVGPG
jgi:MOSC domain-containing protein YiiM